MISKKDNCIPILVEDEAYEGVRLIAEKSAKDMELIIGDRPEIINRLSPDTKQVILYATVGKSDWLDRLEKAGKIDLSLVRGKREVYGIFYCENPDEALTKMLVVAGSDKRGTIYGIFTLSEKIGVSPLLYWGDITLTQTGSISFSRSMEEISKEPSVKYRGFFINDEWPCYGNWTMEHFGGFTAEMYDHVFELLLRLKGNYLWPAMWTSSFALDGPGEENARLADVYGVIMGNSHHEPCLRASEEWDIYKVQNLGYGSEWDYTANKEGLIKYWRDGLKRSGKYESIITIGMRGERDSEMQGTHSLAECIDLLKDIITNQERLISEYADTKERKHPRLLAIYKEVESYYYGDDTTPGLKDWEGLKDTILMFCEDNYGNMRWLPNDSMKSHKGGFGMYYHLDYHGSPISYEWVNSTPLSKIWEQMTQAYEYGVRDVWIVNVGDLKGNEFPLSYFMNLAYDYEKWGVENLESADEFTDRWTKLQFHGQISKEQKDRIVSILTDALLLFYKRRPEALNPEIYHPAHYFEADRMIERASHLQKEILHLQTKLAHEAKSGFYSMIARPLLSGLNLLLAQLYAGKNAWYAKQGKVLANEYADLLLLALKKEKQYNEEFKAFRQGKWSGMELGNHIGFTKWNEDGCKMPVRCLVEPLDEPRMLISRADEEKVYVKNYGTPEVISVYDFMYIDPKPVQIEIANGGNRKFTCKVNQQPCDWISLSFVEKEILVMETLKIQCISERLPKEPQMAVIEITDADAVVRVEVWGQKVDTQMYPQGTFFAQSDMLSMLAKHANCMVPTEDAAWKVLNHFGKSESGCKVFPVGKHFALEEGPSLCFDFVVNKPGTYRLEVYAAPSNADDVGGRMYYGLKVNDEQTKRIASLPEHFRAGNPSCEDWCEGVLMQTHKNTLAVQLREGLNRITIYAVDSGFVLEKLLLYRDELLPSYLGPVESYRK